MMSRFREYIDYMLDNYKIRKFKNLLIIDKFALETPLNIYVIYHTNRYDINNSMKLEEFYSIFYKNLSKKQIEECTRLFAYKNIFDKLTHNENIVKDLIFEQIEVEIKNYEM